jgi:hypothetical protein
LVDREDAHDCATGTRDNAVGKVAIGGNKDVSRHLTHWHLIGGFLKLEDLLVHKLTFFMVNDVRIQGTLLVGLVIFIPRSTASTWQREAREATVDLEVLAMVATLAANVNDC